MLCGQGNKDIFKRWADFVNLGAAAPHGAQLLLDLCTLNMFLDQQVHRLAKDSGALHAFELSHRLQRRRQMIAGDVKPASPGRAHIRQLFQLVGLAAND